MDDKDIYVNGIPIPPPSSFRVGYSDMQENANRDSDAYEHSDEVRSKIRKLYMAWNNINKEQMKMILQAVDPHYIDISYPDDPYTGERHTITSYKGDRDCDLYSFVLPNGTVWKTLTFNCIER